MLTECGVAILFVILVWILYLNWRHQKYPKGPIKWPIFGNLINMALFSKNGALHTLFMEYEKKYGKLVSIDFASFPGVIINDHQLIKEAWNNPLLCGRPKLHAVRERTGGVSRGFMFHDGEQWIEQRRFAIRQLRDFGFGKKSMESLVMDEVLELIEGFKKDAGEAISTQNRFNVAVLNALWTITAGERFSHDDPQLKEIVEAITRNTTQGSAGNAIFFMPWLIKFAPKLSGWEKYKKNLPFTYNFINNFTKARLETYDGISPQNFTDAYIDEIRKTTSPTSSFYGHDGELNLTGTLQDLFVAGAETTSTTLTWTCLYLSLFPEKQAKLQEEIDNVIGSSKIALPSLDNRPLMPYTEAVIMETMRFSSMVPLGLFHRSTQSVMLGSYYIPKDTFLIANLYAAHHKPEVWGDPENYRPERFLSPDGTTTIKHESFIPFSYGKRVCPGESLAKDELFLFITSIFQQFSITLDPNSPKPRLDESRSSTVIIIPKPHKLVFTQR